MTLSLILFFKFLCGKFITAYRIKSVSITDKRVRIMSEVLNSVKLIKMYAWEKCFTDTTGTVLFLNQPKCL